MLLWHTGATIAFIRYAFRDPAMDLRFLALGAILPDLIDLPIGIVAWSRFGAVRLGAHTLLFAAAVMAVVLLATRRGSTGRRRGMLVAVGVLAHLAFDAMWAQPDTLWWPFLGWDFTDTGFASYGAYVRDLLSDPVLWAGEVAGLAYLVYLARRADLGSPDARRALVRQGTVSAPIGGG